MSALAKLFVNPKNIDAIVCKILAPNDNHSKHGVVIPVSAYAMFPDFEGFDPAAQENYTEKIQTIWPNMLVAVTRDSRWKHYHRYPERRMTRLESVVNTDGDGSILVVGRRKSQPTVFECIVVRPAQESYGELLRELSLQPGRDGAFVDLDWSPDKHYVPSAYVDLFIERFNREIAGEWFKSVSSDDSGVGETFESLYKIARNNVSGPDWKDIEFKCSVEGAHTNKRDKKLFLKEPSWIDGTRTLKDRLEKYGYRGKYGELSLFQKASVTENSRGIALDADSAVGTLFLVFSLKPVAKWQHEIIHAAVEAKLRHTVFVTARQRIRNGSTEYRYEHVRYCSHPSGKQLIRAIENGNAWIELRMGPENSRTLKPKNFGTQFRILDRSLADLFSTIQVLIDGKK